MILDVAANLLFCASMMISWLVYCRRRHRRLVLQHHQCSVQHIHLLLTHVFFIASPDDCKPKFNWASLSPQPKCMQGDCETYLSFRIRRNHWIFSSLFCDALSQTHQLMNKYMDRWSAGWLVGRLVGYMIRWKRWKRSWTCWRIE